MDKIAAFMLTLALGYAAFIAACLVAYFVVGYKISLWIFLISWIIIGVILLIGILSTQGRKLVKNAVSLPR